MEKRKLGRSDLEVSVLTFGCWQAGRDGWTDVDDDDSIAAMHAAYDAGINFFDTAESYGGGHSEEVLGKALADRRDDVIIATKLWSAHFSADKVREACEGSLRHLNTDRIDLYQLHWPSGSWGTPVVPIEETMTAVKKLQDEGKIRYIGLSNFNAQQIDEALQYARVESLQPPYSLFWRPYEFDGTFQKCIDEEIGIITYSSLAQGLLTGKFNKDNKPGEDDNRSGNILFKDGHFERALEAVELLKHIGDLYDKNPGQISLQWILEQPGITSAIVGARKVEQVKDNVAATDFFLDAEDVVNIDKIGRMVTDHLPADRTAMWGD